MFEMDIKTYFVSFAFAILCIQMSVGDMDPKLQQCKDKIMTQVSQVKFGQFPKCFDSSKLNQVKNNTDVIQEFYKTITENCKSPKAEDIKGCLEHFRQFMESRSTDLQASFLGAIHSFFDASRGCVNSIVDKVSNLDKWVLNGCADDKPGA